MSFPTGWSRSRLIIDNTKVSGTTNLTNFPVLITEQSLGTSHISFTNSQDGGADLRFTSDIDGSTIFNHETIVWNTSAKKAEVWVKVGTVYATTDTSFYIWYNNGTATSTSSGTAVWTNGFQAVYHLNQGGGSALDSTSNNYTLTAGTSTPGSVTGQVGSAVDFESSNSQFMVGTAANANTRNSQSWFSWVKFESGTTDQMTVGFRAGTGGPNYGFNYLQSTKKIRFDLDGLSGASNLNSSGTVATATWYFVAGIYDQSAGSTKIWINNTLTSGSATGTASSISSRLVLGKNGEVDQYYYDGILDEVYITNDAKSDGWVETYYNNTNDPAGFIDVAEDYQRNISDNLSISDVIYKESAYFRNNQDILEIEDTNFATFIQIITIAQDIVGIEDSIVRQVDFNKNIQDTITIDDILQRTINYNRDLQNTINLTDTVIGSKIKFISLLDNIEVSDSVNIKIVTSDVENPIIEFYGIDEIKPTIYNITNG